MKSKGAGRKEVRVGLDIGTRLIKALELSSENGTHKLTQADFAKIDFPLSAEKTHEALKSLLERFRPGVKDVNISLSAPSAIVRFIRMPKMKSEDLKNSLRFEAEKYIPFNISEVVIDASILEDATDAGKDMRVVLAAAKKSVVDSRIAMLKELGLSAAVIDIDSFACFNAFSNSEGLIEESRNIAFLNIGYTQTNVIISSGNQPFFTRDIPIGGKEIVKALSKEFATGENEAESLIFDPKDRAAQVFEVAKSVLTNLVEELRLSFGYYENQHARNVNEIYLSGGIAELGGIPEFLEEHFGIKPKTWDPFAKFELAKDAGAKAPESLRRQFAVCAGLAIRK